MNFIFHNLSINTNHLLLGKTEVLKSDVQFYIKNKAINLKQIVNIELSLDINHSEELETAQNNLKELLKSIFNKQIPAFSILPQTNLEYTDGQLRMIVCDSSEYSIAFKEFQKHYYTLCQSPKNKIIISGGIHFNEHQDILRSAQLGFDFMEQLLDYEEMHFGHIINQSIKINEHYLNNNDSQINNWELIDQVRQLYFDPNLFKQNFPSLSLTASKTGGFICQFIAASKDTFPIHQVVNQSNDLNQQISISIIKDWKKAFFNTSNKSNDSGVSGPDNIISQCDDVISLVKETLNKIALEQKGNFKLENLIVYLKNSSDLEDAKLMINGQFPEEHTSFIQTKPEHPETLIELSGIASITS